MNSSIRLPATLDPARSGAGRPARGFSLIEVVIAFGIFTFCLVSIVYLLGTALASSRQSQVDSALVGILRNMDSELRALPFTNASGLSLNSPALLDPNGTNFYFDQGGSRTTNPSSRAYRVTLSRASGVESLTALAGGGHNSPGISNASNHYLWTLQIGFPPPAYPQSVRLLVGRTLLGAGTWTAGGVTYSFYE